LESQDSDCTLRSEGKGLKSVEKFGEIKAMQFEESDWKLKKYRWTVKGLEIGK
jgi:hypothetical protein